MAALDTVNHGRPRVAIIGGGISGMAAAERIARIAPDVDVILIEASDRLGGIIQTELLDDFVVDHGPDVALSTKPGAIELADRVGLSARMIRASTAGALVGTPQGLRRLPHGMAMLAPTRWGPLWKSGILSTHGFLRLVAERAIGSRANDDDESVESFAVRRVGRECYERITEPLLTGIYGGDGSRLSILSTFPQLRELERRFGSVARGLPIRSPGAAASPVQSPFFSFPNGMGELAQASANYLLAQKQVQVRLRADVRRIGRIEGKGSWVIESSAAERVLADAVILATPAPVSARMLLKFDEKLSEALSAFEHGSTSIVTLAFRKTDLLRPLNGTGYVLPRILGRNVLACTWSSSKFSGRAPEEMALLRVFIGGAHRPLLPMLDDRELIDIAREQLRYHGITAAKPTLWRVTRWVNAMPQYIVGHRDRVANVERLAGCHQGLAVAGNTYHGVGIPDCVRSGSTAADQVLAGLRISTDVSTAYSR